MAGKSETRYLWRELPEMERRFHNLLVSSGAIEETNDTFPDLTVFKIVEGSRYNTNTSSEPIYKYFYDYHYRRESTAKEKLGICLHFTAGWLKGDLQCLTIPRSGVSPVTTPFLVGRSGHIYQLHDPDYYGWHLGSTLGKNIASIKRGQAAVNVLYHPRVIGIEISNYGTLYLRGKRIDCNGGAYCTINDEEAYHDIRKMGYNEPYRKFGTLSSNGFYFASYTKEQYEAVSRLIRALCKKYPFNPDNNTGIKPELLPEDIRYEYFGPTDKYLGNFQSQKILDAGWSRDRFINEWRGISSHVNWKGKVGGKWAKWDIGPAFEWDRILPTDRINLPLQKNCRGDIESPISYFSNSERNLLGAGTTSNKEREFKGGLYPATGNSMLHGGVHLSCRRDSFTEIKACAPGYIVAARMAGYDIVKPDDELNENIFKNFIRNKDLSFVLIRHDCNIWNNSENSMELEGNTSFYSLYMHLVEPDWQLIEGNRKGLNFYSTANHYKNVKWLRKILMGRKVVYSLDNSGDVSMNVDGVSRPFDFGRAFLAASSEPVEATPGRLQVYGESNYLTINREKIYAKTPPELKKAYDSLKAGKIITFSDAYIPVKGGEVIGYVESTPDVRHDGDFFHFEIFSESGDEGAIKKLLKKDEELKKKFDNLQDQEDENLVNQSDASTLKESTSSSEKGIPEISSLDSLSFPDDNKTKCQNDMLLFRKAINSLFSTGLCNVEGADNRMTQVELSNYYLTELKIDDVSEIVVSKDDIITIDLGNNGGVVIEKSSSKVRNFFTIEELQKGVELYVPAKAQTMTLSCKSFHLECTIEARQEREWFKKIIVNRLRHIVLEHKSEWRESGMQGLLDKLVGRGITLRGSDVDVDVEPDVLAAHAKTICWWATSGSFGEETIYSSSSIFGSMLPADGLITNIHPVTFLWYLSLLKREFKFSFKERYELELDNKPEYWGFSFDEGYLFGKEAAIFVIGEKFQGGKELSLKLKREDGGSDSLKTIDSLRKVKFSSEGIDTLSIPLNFFGKWKLLVNNSDCNKKPVCNLLEIEKPQNYISLELIEFPEDILEMHEENYFKQGLNEVVGKNNPGEQALLLFTFNKKSGNFPHIIEGLVFLRYQKHKKTELPVDDRWSDYGYAVPIVAGELEEEPSGQPDLVQYRAAFYPDYIIGDVMITNKLQSTDEIISFQLAFVTPNGGINFFIREKECKGNGYKLDKNSIKDLIYTLDYVDTAWIIEKPGFEKIQFTMGSNAKGAGLLIVKVPLVGNVRIAKPRITLNGNKITLKKDDKGMLEAEVNLYGRASGAELKFKVEVTDKEAFEGAQDIQPVDRSFSTKINLDESMLNAMLYSIEGNPERVKVILSGEGVAHCVPTNYIFALYYKLNKSGAKWQQFPKSSALYYREVAGQYKGSSSNDGVFFDMNGSLQIELTVPKRYFISSASDNEKSIQFKIVRKNGNGTMYGQKINSALFKPLVLTAETGEENSSNQTKDDEE